MTNLKEELTALALGSGAVRARVTIKERLDGPPSADPTRVLPGARSVLSYAVHLGRDFIPDYFGKVTRMAFKRVVFDSFQLVGTVGRDWSGPFSSPTQPNGACLSVSHPCVAATAQASDSSLNHI